MREFDPLTDAELDALLGDETLHRDWRYRATGMTQAQALALPRSHSLRIGIPDLPYRDLIQRARAAETSRAGWIKRIVHAHLAQDPTCDPRVLKWWGDG